MYKRMSLRLTAALIMSSALVAPAAASVTVGTPSIGGNCFPFSCSYTGTYQQVYGASAFSGVTTINTVDRVTILLLVYTSFCDSFQQGVWSGNGAAQLGLLLAICTGLFALVMMITAAASRALGFTREDRIAAMFCGSKKTLASGVPMAKLIFGAHPGLGLILLPIMIYHPLQLIVCGVLAQRWSRQQ